MWHHHAPLCSPLAESGDGPGGRYVTDNNTLNTGGVWLATDGGGRLFLPLSDDPLPHPKENAPHDDELEADRETLDAACRLMPSLPREFIAQVLELGPYRPVSEPVSECAVAG